MKCKEVRLTEVCKDCNVGNKEIDCPTVNNESSTIAYEIPPYSIFNLVPYKNNIGEKVICISNHNNSLLKVGEIYTIIEQFNEHFGYIRLEEFKQYPNMSFGPDIFKKVKAIYNDKEYTLSFR